MTAILTLLDEKITALGFEVWGVCAPELPARAAEGLSEYLAQGHHGGMEWMQARAEIRGDIKNLWPEAKSVIVVGHNYAPPADPMQKLQQPHIGNISVYAQHEDYHDVMKKKLKILARWLVETQGGDVKVFVDTAPLMEKPLAAMAGIGWQGKHTCLVSREYGSWLFLGALFTTLPIPARGRGHVSSVETTPQQVRGSCGTCSQCIDICPTQAIIAPYKLDARKCISYLTIEHKGSIPVEYRRAMGNRIYGCDDCLAVCPWNKFAQTAREAAYHTRNSLQSPMLTELVQLDDAAFRTMFRKSPIKRIGRNRFIRNVLIAIGNTQDPHYLPIIAPLREDDDAVIRETAHWAIDEISGVANV